MIFIQLVSFLSLSKAQKENTHMDKNHIQPQTMGDSFYPLFMANMYQKFENFQGMGSQHWQSFKWM
jgi:hypothetical protein